MGSNEYYYFFDRIEQGKRNYIRTEIDICKFAICGYLAATALGALAFSVPLLTKESYLSLPFSFGLMALPLIPVIKSIKRKNKLEKELEKIL